MNTELTISTKPDARAEKVNTALTINWEGVSEEQLRAMAQQSLVVKLQSNLRRAFEKDNAAIPATLTVNAKDYVVGSRAPKKSAFDTVMASLGNLTQEQKDALRATLVGE